MKLRKPTKTWQKPRKPNLLRHKSGRYYARAFASGKEVWKLLTTSHYSVARLGYIRNTSEKKTGFRLSLQALLRRPQANLSTRV